MSHPDSEEPLLQEDKAEQKEKQQQQEEEEEKGEKGVKEEETDGSVKQQDMEVMAAGDWPREQEVERSDWPRERVCHTHERAIPIQETVEALDITEEGMWKHTQGYGHETMNENKSRCYMLLGR